ncbi:MAG: DUF4032 domain-containing protein [Chloroflexota bacterium]
MDLARFKAESDFNRAFTKAFWREIFTVITGKSRYLLSFDQVTDTLRLSCQSYRGLQTVPVDKIIGSVGRYMDFDRAFLPLRWHTKERWKRIDMAYYHHQELPPVQLYKVGEAYFVRDGNHRVSVAREQGVAFIDAEVIECVTRLPMTADMRPEDLEAQGEYAEFLERTNFDRLYPGEEIRFSIPGMYDKLWDHIMVHKYYLETEQSSPLSQDKAVASWYENVYLPVVNVIREHQILGAFPNRTEADLYVWIMDHRYFLAQQAGRDLGPERAARDFASRFGGGSVRVMLRRIGRRLRRLRRPIQRRRREKSATNEPPGLDVL